MAKNRTFPIDDPMAAELHEIELLEDDFKIIGSNLADSDKIVRPAITYWQDAWRRLKKNPVAMISLFVLIIVALLAIFAPIMTGWDLYMVDPTNKNLEPSGLHLFGTDALGRDLFTRVWAGARVSLIVALACTAIQAVVGCLYGGIMAYFGGMVDDVMMRIIEILQNIPSLLVTMLMMMVLGNGIGALLVALCITSWCGTARQMRGMIMQLRESEYVLAAETLGASPTRIIVKHLIPNCIGVLILNLATHIPGYIFTESSLSFLGIGLTAPNISLGNLLSTGQELMMFYPTQLICPAAVLCVIVLAFNLLGDGLRDALDPRLRQ